MVYFFDHLLMPDFFFQDSRWGKYKKEKQEVGVLFHISFPLISDQALSAQIGIQCLLINQNYVVHKFQEQDLTRFTPEIYIYIICI